MKRNVKNEKVLKAITIGLATMIAATSAPVNVFATEDDQDNNNLTIPNNDESSNEQSINAAETVEGQAETEVGEAQSAVQEVVYIPNPVENNDFATASLNDFAESLNPEVSVEIVSLVDSDQDGIIDTDENGNIITKNETVEYLGESNIVDVLDAVDVDLNNVKNDLEDAKAADKEADQAAGDVAGEFKNAVDVVAEATKPADEAKALLDKVNDPNSSAADIQDAFNKLGEVLPEDTEAYVEAKKTAFTSIKNKYITAKGNLTDAENKLDVALKYAGEQDVKNAQARVDAAKDWVDDISEAYSKVGGDLAKETADKEKIEAQLGKTNNKWESQALLIVEVVKDYILPRIETEGEVTDLQQTKADGVNAQNSKRYIFTYKVNGKEKTLYFNYDKDDRTINPNDMWATLGSSKNIVIYERSLEEVEADEYIVNYNKQINSKWKPTNNAAFKNDVNNGRYDVFVFKNIDGVNEYKTRVELENDKATLNEDGTFEFEGKSYRKVEQTTSKTEGAKTFNVAEYIKDFNKFADEYENYGEKINTASQQLEEAQTAITELSGAINSIKPGGDRIFNKLAPHNFGMVIADQPVEVSFDDIVKELKPYLTADEIEALKSADSTADALDILDGALGRAEEELNGLQDKLDKLKEERDEIASKLFPGTVDDTDDGVADSADDDSDDDGSDDDDTAGDAGFAGPSGYVASSGFGATPIILPSTTAIFGGTGTAGGEGSGVLGARTGNREDIGANKITTPAPNKGVVTIPANIDSNTNSKGKGKETLIKLEDPVVPLAESPFEDSTRLNWGWLLIIFLLGATGKKLYDEYKKKQEEANAAKSK